MVIRNIALQAVGSDRDTFIQAMMLSYDEASENEELVSLELIAN